MCNTFIHDGRSPSNLIFNLLKRFTFSFVLFISSDFILNSLSEAKEKETAEFQKMGLWTFLLF